MLRALPQLSDYDISPQTGFLPAEIPLEILPDRYYQPWETIVQNLQSLILSKRLRQMVDALPILSTDLLLTEAEWRRAYSLLGFIAHAYVWGGDTPSDVSHPYPNPIVQHGTNSTKPDCPPAYIHAFPRNMPTP